MEGFLIMVNGQEFYVKQGLHENLYEVSNSGKKFLVGKRETGEWEVMLQDSDQTEISASEIGKVIDNRVKE
ncbi:hypothetical protein [Desertivirga arenae]|uniref:hypothetical protein n=1 Tax=Desertivirga arenae TaxID=2810309 RepID=UPI001A970BA3|nr:hypothetical protein [Pedobacter sp. SYSU D00823]